MKPIEYITHHHESDIGILSGMEFIIIPRAYQKVHITSMGDFIYKKNIMYKEHHDKLQLSVRTKKYYNHRFGQFTSDNFQLIYGSTDRNNILELR